MTEPTSEPSATNAAEGELTASVGVLAGIAVGTVLVILLAVITTTVIIVVAISCCRCKKKKDKTDNQLHHTLPLYDTIPGPNNGTAVSRQAIVICDHTILERLDRESNMMQPPNDRPMGRTHLEGHNNVVWDGNQRTRESNIQTSENEAYTYVLADKYMHVPVQETNPEEYVNAYPGSKEAEQYIYPVTNKWVVHIKQKD